MKWTPFFCMVRHTILHIPWFQWCNSLVTICYYNIACHLALQIKHSLYSYTGFYCAEQRGDIAKCMRLLSCHWLSLFERHASKANIIGFVHHSSRKQKVEQARWCLLALCQTDINLSSNIWMKASLLNWPYPCTNSNNITMAYQCLSFIGNIVR